MSKTVSVGTPSGGWSIPESLLESWSTSLTSTGPWKSTTYKPWTTPTSTGTWTGTVVTSTAPWRVSGTSVSPSITGTYIGSWSFGPISDLTDDEKEIISAAVVEALVAGFTMKTPSLKMHWPGTIVGTGTVGTVGTITITYDTT